MWAEGVSKVSALSETGIGDGIARAQSIAATAWISMSASGCHSAVTPTPVIAGYSVPASSRQMRPISLPLAW
ncbi:Uncharacterised protein [Mycobacteroides abscessus subsp. abscessus]|nr:Uncharacterised protein [Mycobacteroides abscessus subsp. abscessus]